MGLALKNKTIDKYFRFLLSLDNSSKKKLIIKLTESIEDNNETKVSLQDLSGAWIDSRNSDEIINDIKNSRVEKQNTIDF